MSMHGCHRVDRDAVDDRDGTSTHGQDREGGGAHQGGSPPPILSPSLSHSIACAPATKPLTSPVMEVISNTPRPPKAQGQQAVVCRWSTTKQPLGASGKGLTLSAVGTGPPIRSRLPRHRCGTRPAHRPGRGGGGGAGHTTLQNPQSGTQCSHNQRVGGGCAGERTRPLPSALDT